MVRALQRRLGAKRFDQRDEPIELGPVVGVSGGGWLDVEEQRLRPCFGLAVLAEGLLGPVEVGGVEAGEHWRDAFAWQLAEAVMDRPLGLADRYPVFEDEAAGRVDGEHLLRSRRVDVVQPHADPWMAQGFAFDSRQTPDRRDERDTDQPRSRTHAPARLPHSSNPGATSTRPAAGHLL